MRAIAFAATSPSIPTTRDHALAEIDRCVAQGAIGIKLAASRRADDPLLDPIAAEAARRGVPVLHHIWQHRRRDWPGQEASDAVELARLAARHPSVAFILAHIGGGGDWQHTLPALADVPNVYVDLSGSGVDRGMLDRTVAAVGASRLLWGSDLTMETGLAKLWALEVIGLTTQDLQLIRWRNAARIFPATSFPALASAQSGRARRGSEGLVTTDVHTWIGGYPFRDVPHPDPEVLVRVLEREGIASAWVGHLPSAFWRDPSTATKRCSPRSIGGRECCVRCRACARTGRQWERSLRDAAERGAPAVRAYPPQWGLVADGSRDGRLAAACGEAGLVLVLTTRFEDARQRHWMDTAGDLTGAAIRAVARASDSVHVVVCAAGRALIEEVHWGLTPVGARTRVVGYFVALGSARGRPRAPAADVRRGPLRVWHCVAAAADADAAREPRAAARRPGGSRARGAPTRS